MIKSMDKKKCFTGVLKRIGPSVYDHAWAFGHRNLQKPLIHRQGENMIAHVILRIPAAAARA